MKHPAFSRLPQILMPALLIALFLFSSPAQAQNFRSITIIPPKFETFANPGDTITEKIRIKNESNFPVNYSIVIEDFSSSGEEGYVVLEEEGTDSSYSLANWIEPSVKDITLQPNEERPISFTVYIPRDAEPGGHYASILFQSGSDETPGVANVSQRIGSLILLRVSGNVTEDAQIETFETPTYSQEGPINFTLRVKNNGNVHIRPKGTIIITNIFGQKVEEIPLNGSNVLPDAIRKMDTQWEKESMLGQYTATLVATYGQQNLPLTAAVKFTVVSATSLILIGVALIASIVFILSLISGRSRLLKALRVLTGGD